LITDARAPGSNHKIETDGCIAGAGPAGIALALEFVGELFRVCPAGPIKRHTPVPDALR
jgi:hypothetical protein